MSTTGGMSPGEGTTTTVPLQRGPLRPDDESVLCSAICKCKDTPGIGADGRKLNQMCVSGRLKTLDGIMYGRSTYKPEVNYDMTQRPPAPIMSSTDDMQPHGWLSGWIKKHWGDAEAKRPPFQPGSGMVRRPDVVIVEDPNRPPTQDNIRQVIEIKFPGDKLTPGQQRDYTRIAGDPAKFKLLESSECNCEQVKQREQQQQEQVKKIGVGMMILYALGEILTRGRMPPLETPPTVPAPVLP
jgi:hypothetical protein